MVRGFSCSDTERLHTGYFVKRFSGIEDSARRRLRFLDAAVSLGDLAAIRGNHLEGLSGHRKGQYSIRINDQWRICFRWVEGHPVDVEIVDYH